MAVGGQSRRSDLSRKWIRKGRINRSVHLHAGGARLRSLHGSRESTEEAAGKIEKNSPDYRNVVDFGFCMCIALAD